MFETKPSNQNHAAIIEDYTGGMKPLDVRAKHKISSSNLYALLKQYHVPAQNQYLSGRMRLRNKAKAKRQKMAKTAQPAQPSLVRAEMNFRSLLDAVVTGRLAEQELFKSYQYKVEP